MIRGPLFEDGYKPQFSGHETFPLRYGWLKKVYDEIEVSEKETENKKVFLGDDAIARFGVGKNMVASMRHWASSCRVIDDSNKKKLIQCTAFGRKIFGARGIDPYMEHPSTLWLIHWHLATFPEKTTWFWAFSHYPAITFDRENIVNGLIRLANERNWSRVAPTTIKNDVACFVRTYVAQKPSSSAGIDDALESPLTELGLIKAIGKRDGFRFVRGPKSTLGNGVFIYALLDFWSNYSADSATLSFEAIAHEPGSPGRVFLLDENDIVDRLSNIDNYSNSALQWSETAGLKQVVRKPNLDLGKTLEYIKTDYESKSDREAA